MPYTPIATRRPAVPFLTKFATGLALATVLGSTAARAQDVAFKTPDGRMAEIHIVPGGGNRRTTSNTEIWVDNDTLRDLSGLTNVCLINPQDGKSRIGSIVTSDTGMVIPNWIMAPLQKDMEQLGKTPDKKLTAEAIADARKALQITDDCRQSPTIS